MGRYQRNSTEKQEKVNYFIRLTPQVKTSSRTALK